MGSHYAAADNIYRVQSHVFGNLRLASFLGHAAARSLVSASPHTISALPTILRCGLRVQMGYCRRPLGEKNVENAFPHSRRQKRCLISIPKDAADKAEFDNSSDSRCGTPTRLLLWLTLRVEFVVGIQV